LFILVMKFSEAMMFYLRMVIGENWMRLDIENIILTYHEYLHRITQVVVRIYLREYNEDLPLGQ
jgi:hypothetical protein